MPDLHNHTPWCNHASGHPREYLAQARSRGIGIFGFSEHCPWMLDEPGEQLKPTEAEFDDYWSLMLDLRAEEEARGELDLRLGVEMDYIPEKLGVARAFAAKYPFDYHLFSIHNIGPWILDHPGRVSEWDGRDVDAVYRQYFAMQREMLAWGLVDIVAHLDLPKKFGHRASPGLVEQLVAETIPHWLKAGVAVEINTAGRDKPAGEYYPAESIVRLMAEAGVPITIGSDAHRPQEVGRYRDDVLAMLARLGVKELATFRRRERVMIPLSEATRR